MALGTHCVQFEIMKTFAWNPDKNDRLKKERGISFEEVVFHIEAGHELDILDHPNKERYPHQKMSMVQIENYVYLVPFIETETEIFLKTIFPSRKATKLYLGADDDQT
jgi:uncharacterized DUF497 family protein